MIVSVDSYGINNTGKYNFPHNNHWNKYHSVKTKNPTEERENKSIHLHISLCLNDVERTTHNTIQIK